MGWQVECSNHGVAPSHEEVPTTTAFMGGSPDGRAALNSALHDIAWGLLLTLAGAVWLVPVERVTQPSHGSRLQI